MVDISQCVSRRWWSSGALLVHTGSKMYDFEHDQLLTPLANCSLQGMPTPDLDFGSLSSTDIRDLAGEAMFLPNLATILWAVYANEHAPWWHA
jgi:hypothetical protein